MGTIKTTNIEPIADNGTVTLGSSGDTFTVPSGVTITNNGTQTGFGGTNASAFLVTKSSSQAIAANTWTQVTLDQEIFDTDGVFASNAFTVPSTGKYYLFSHARIDSPNGGQNVQLAIYKGGSFYSGLFNDRVYANTNGHEIFCHFGGVTSLTASDVITLYARAATNAESVNGGTGGTPTGIESYTGMGAFKLIE